VASKAAGGTGIVITIGAFIVGIEITPSIIGAVETFISHPVKKDPAKEG